MYFVNDIQYFKKGKKLAGTDFPSLSVYYAIALFQVSSSSTENINEATLEEVVTEFHEAMKLSPKTPEFPNLLGEIFLSWYAAAAIN